MAKKLIISQDAHLDRFNILEYYFKKTGSKKYPIHLFKQFENAFRLIKSFPGSGKRLNTEGDRKIIISNYLIIYRIKDYIEILHIWDTRQDPKKLPL